MARIRAREITEKLRGKADPEVVAILVSLAEDASEYRQQVAELTQMTERMVKVVELYNQGFEGMAKQFDEFKGKTHAVEVDGETKQ